MQVRENVTCEGVLFTLSIGRSRLMSPVNDTLSFLMSEDPKQDSLFFEALIA